MLAQARRQLRREQIGHVRLKNPPGNRPIYQVAKEAKLRPPAVASRQ